MKRLCSLLAVATALAIPALAQNQNPFAGRWDLTLTGPNGSWPQWMEVVNQDGKVSGRIQPRGGAVRPIVAAKMESGHLLITVQAAGRGPEVSWDLTVSGDQLAGVQKQGENEAKIAGVRAPALDRPAPKAWTQPEPLFNGKDLTGWEPVNNPQSSRWVVKDGTLFNEARGSNIRTSRTFDDFKLHLEVMCPEHCNSGIYMRGRDEIQVGTEGGTQPSHEMGAFTGSSLPRW